MTYNVFDSMSWIVCHNRDIQCIRFNVFDCIETGEKKYMSSGAERTDEGTMTQIRN